MASPGQKLAAEPEGDSPEVIAWALSEWVRQVEQVVNRHGLLGVFNDCLVATRVGAPEHSADNSGSATGTHRRLAYRLTRLVAEMEGRDLGQRNQGDKKWILETFAECLEAALGKRQVADVELAPA